MAPTPHAASQPVPPGKPHGSCRTGDRKRDCVPGLAPRGRQVREHTPQVPQAETRQSSLRGRHSDARVAPGLFIAASDSKHFWGVADQIFRFNPVTLHVSETSMSYPPSTSN